MKEEHLKEIKTVQCEKIEFLGIVDFNPAEKLSKYSSTADGIYYMTSITGKELEIKQDQSMILCTTDNQLYMIHDNKWVEIFKYVSEEDRIRENLYDAIESFSQKMDSISLRDLTFELGDFIKQLKGILEKMCMM